MERNRVSAMMGRQHAIWRGQGKMRDGAALVVFAPGDGSEATRKRLRAADCLALPGQSS